MSLEGVESNPDPTCGICFEPFRATYSPLLATLTATSSTKLPFGLHLSCPEKHSYCISCLTEYIKQKLDPTGTGEIDTSTTVFPIRCPECPITQWEAGIQDNIAEKVLDAESMNVWVCPISEHFRLAASRCYFLVVSQKAPRLDPQALLSESEVFGISSD